MPPRRTLYVIYSSPVSALASRVPRCANRTEMHATRTHLASFFAAGGRTSFHGNIYIPKQIRDTSLIQEIVHSRVTCVEE